MSFDLSNTESLRIGFGAQTYFTGDIADVRLHAKALTPDEVAGLRSDGQEGEKKTAQIPATRQIPFQGFAANEVYPADLDGDGQYELLCLQSPGCYQSDIFNGTRYEVRQQMRDIFCLTAINLEGDILWQIGTPCLEFERPTSHVADQMLWVGELKPGGKPGGKTEIAVIRGRTLLVLDGATGETNRSVELDADNYVIVRGLKSRDGYRLFVQNTDAARLPYEYGMPAQLYDAATLEHVATLGDALGSGHSPRAIDFEGDGVEEILVGYDAYDANGLRLWRMTQLGEVNPVKNHVDQLQVGLLPEANTPFVVYAGSDNVVLGTLSGQLLWKARFGHPQHVVLGQFGAGDDAAPIAIYCCRDLVGEAQQEFLDKRGLPVPQPGNRNNIALVNHRGEVVNVLFPPQLKYHSGEGILVYPQGCADGSDAIVTRDWEWPQMLDSHGAEVCQLVRGSPHREENRLTVGPGEDGYGVRIVNFDDDAKAEILIHDQSTLWVFDPPYPAAGVPHTHDRLEPITGQGLYRLAPAATR